MKPGDHPPDETNPSVLDEEARRLLTLAVDASRGHDWDTAIASYQTLLRKFPKNAVFRVALGRIFEKKSQDGAEKAFLISAMEQYRQALKQDPQFLEANEALIAAARRAGTLEEIIGEYRQRFKDDPDNRLFRDFMRKAEVLLTLSQTASKSEKAANGRLVVFIVKRILPAAALVGFFTTVTLRFAPQTPLTALLAETALRAGIGFAALYLICRLILSRI